MRLCVHLAFFMENWALFGSFQALQFWQHQMLLLRFFFMLRAASTEVLEKGQKEPIFSKKWFRFYISRMNEFCLLHFINSAASNSKTEFTLPHSSKNTYPFDRMAPSVHKLICKEFLPTWITLKSIKKHYQHFFWCLLYFLCCSLHWLHVSDSID